VEVRRLRQAGEKLSRNGKQGGAMNRVLKWLFIGLFMVILAPFAIPFLVYVIRLVHFLFEIFFGDI
jgi:hypothetical protein